MSNEVKNWKIIAKNGVVLGVFKGTQLQAWQQCCKAMGINENKPVKTIEPGLTFSSVDEREWKPTHILINGAQRIEVFAEQSENYPNLVNLYTRDEWLHHEANHWDLCDKKIRRNGKEVNFAALQER